MLKQHVGRFARTGSHPIRLERVKGRVRPRDPGLHVGKGDSLTKAGGRKGTALHGVDAPGGGLVDTFDLTPKWRHVPKQARRDGIVGVGAGPFAMCHRLSSKPPTARIVIRNVGTRMVTSVVALASPDRNVVPSRVTAVSRLSHRRTAPSIRIDEESIDGRPPSGTTRSLLALAVWTFWP